MISELRKTTRFVISETPAPWHTVVFFLGGAELFAVQRGHMSLDRGLDKPYIPAGSQGCNHRLYTHAAQFYFDDQVLVRFTSEFLISALLAGDSAVILATASHQRAIAEKLSARGIDAAHYADEGRYVAIDADEALAEYLSAGENAITRFRRRMLGVLTDVNRAATVDNPRAMVFGELVLLFWQRRAPAAVLALEQLWEDLAAEHSFSLFCGYSIRDFADAGSENHFFQICAAHSTLIPPEQYPSDEIERRLLTACQARYKA